MTTATQNLENDHMHIIRLIGVMERIIGTMDPRIEHLETIIKVVREFADGQHLAKEEQLLFPLMVSKGFSNETGPVAVMLHEHELARNFVLGMAENILLFKKGERIALSAIYNNMLGYTGLLKGHIGKENTVLYRMADNVLTISEQETLLLDFMKIEHFEKDGLIVNDYLKLIDDLEDYYSNLDTDR
ncbi:MAG: hemerythrin domain-containing protein [Bacteroidales bacterium]|nr:hemerythrin domain-containing protein [Bacteroidales bacterium]MBK9358263.1 hemerythrin domain-containing protein [Bacteroidales bacterium]